MKSYMYSIMSAFILLSIPLQVFAHGTEEEHQQEVLSGIFRNVSIAALIFFVLFIVVWFVLKNKMKTLNVKRQEEFNKRQRLNKVSKIIFGTSIVFLAGAVLFGYLHSNQSGKDQITFMHVHGLDYTGDGEEIYVPAHDGLKIYANGTWSNQKEGELHDFMGFSMTENGFYSSGHPAPGSDMANPFGIVKSTDKGKTLEILDLYEEIDFHWMTVGYRTEDIYVFNPEPNSRMDEQGFYYTTDQTKTWNQTLLAGILGNPSSLAAHPTISGMIAIGTDQGVFLSNDYGNNFEPVLDGVVVSAVAFDHNHSLLVAMQDQLVSINLNDNSQFELNMPELGSNDSILYVRQNPTNEDQYVFATVNKDIYLTNDNGETWSEIVDEGTAQ